MSKSVTDVLDNLNKAITDAQVSKLSSDMQQLMTQIKSAIDSANIGPLSDDARKLLASLEKSNGDLQKILKNVEPATRLNAEQIKSIVSSLKVTTDNFSQFSAEIKAKPSLILWGTPKAQPTPTPRKSR
jgi:ABC-type transporter Mla subunit MlaD